ncbi:hypothetical protein GCM10009764_43990 [Nocardia ninae]|uniref:Uncharacterized protein n=1 Tax=Nocardia ninae NBRC 108245 TaxID=1210091 RepID=A0A511M9P7_9NOCA|nr:hypothetical protein NN4_14460 [Nocardia ninae NBRC 108245]
MTVRVLPLAGSGALGSAQALLVSRSSPTTPAPAMFVVVRTMLLASSGVLLHPATTTVAHNATTAPIRRRATRAVPDRGEAVRFPVRT